MSTIDSFSSQQLLFALFSCLGPHLHYVLYACCEVSRSEVIGDTHCWTSRSLLCSKQMSMHDNQTRVCGSCCAELRLSCWGHWDILGLCGVPFQWQCARPQLPRGLHTLELTSALVSLMSKTSAWALRTHVPTTVVQQALWLCPCGQAHATSCTSSHLT